MPCRKSFPLSSSSRKMRPISFSANFRQTRLREQKPVAGSREQTMSESTVAWYPVCRVDEIAEEDVRQFEHSGQTYAIYHTPSGFYATEGLCTHEEEFLADGR